jgi:hypothetical protein
MQQRGGGHDDNVGWFSALSLLLLLDQSMNDIVMVVLAC